MSEENQNPQIHNPDILECLSNLSNDEIFTPPRVVNEMLNLLPKRLFKSKKAKFLDPFCKSGVFLREIAKRLIEGLKDEIPDLQERLDHIFKNQLYGIAITEMTSLLSRRSLYCSKYPNSRYSITQFDNASGNIRTPLRSAPARRRGASLRAGCRGRGNSERRGGRGRR